MCSHVCVCTNVYAYMFMVVFFFGGVHAAHVCASRDVMLFRVRMCVCQHVDACILCARVCLYLCVCMYLHAWMYVCACMCMHARLYMNACVYVYVCMFCISTCVHVCKYFCVCARMCMRIFVYVRALGSKRRSPRRWKIGAWGALLGLRRVPSNS